MSAISGTVSWGIVPLDWNTSNLASMSWDYRSNYLKSANDQLRYQVQYKDQNLRESNEVGNTKGVVNVIFKIEASIDDTNWETIGVIRKSRDMVNKRYDDDTSPVLHRFTIDISQLVSDQLSYSLCPIGKGTWQSNYWGGMNGGLTMQDNVIGGLAPSGNPISAYNVSKNGTYRLIKVSATFGVLNAAKEIVTATNSNGSVYILGSRPTVTYINSVNQFEKDDAYYNGIYTMNKSAGYEFLTRCPNWSGGGVTQDFKKPVRIDEEAEWLSFYLRSSEHTNIRPGLGSPDVVGAMGIKIVTYESDGSNNTFYLRDFEDNLVTYVAGSSQTTIPVEYQNQMFTQNISPDYITTSGKVYSKSNARVTFPYWNVYTGDTITSNTLYYTATLTKQGMFSPHNEKLISRDYYYNIDRETENIPFGFVRFHWLNSLGATDSYTAKRNVVEGLTISRDVIERKSGDRTWYQANSGGVSGSEVSVPNSNYISDTMRGGDIYKGGREVSRVNADRVQSVFTEPLNKSVAKWLEEMMLSPNVWIEMDTKGTARGNSSNPYLRPSTKEYIPVIITNSDIETVNQDNTLVKFNIEYTLAHKVQTQRN